VKHFNIKCFKSCKTFCIRCTFLLFSKNVERDIEKVSLYYKPSVFYTSYRAAYFFVLYRPYFTTYHAGLRYIRYTQMHIRVICARA